MPAATSRAMANGHVLCTECSGDVMNNTDIVSTVDETS